MHNIELQRMAIECVFRTIFTDLSFLPGHTPNTGRPTQALHVGVGTPTSPIARRTSDVHLLNGGRHSSSLNPLIRCLRPVDNQCPPASVEVS